MINPERLVQEVLGSVLGGRPKRSRRARRWMSRGFGDAGHYGSGSGLGDIMRGATRVTRGVGHMAGGRGFWSRPSTLLGMLGVAWGVLETLQNQGTHEQPGSQGGQGQWGGGGLGSTPPNAPPSSSAPAGVPPIPTPSATPGASDGSADALRVVRLAVSAAHADGPMNETERAAILRHAKDAGVEQDVEAEIARPRPLAEIVAGVADAAERATLYVLAYTVLRADEAVTGAEKIYLAQLAHLLGLDRPTVEALERDTAVRIDAAGDGASA